MESEHSYKPRNIFNRTSLLLKFVIAAWLIYMMLAALLFIYNRRDFRDFPIVALIAFAPVAVGFIAGFTINWITIFRFVFTGYSIGHLIICSLLLYHFLPLTPRQEFLYEDEFPVVQAPEGNSSLRARSYDTYEKFDTVAAAGIELLVPRFMDSTRKLNQYAQIQFLSIWHGIYLTVITEDLKSVTEARLKKPQYLGRSDLEFYTDHYVKGFQIKAENGFDSLKLWREWINAMNSNIGELRYLQNDSLQIFKMAGLFVGEKRCAIVTIWTINYPSVVRNLFLRILRSVKEVPFKKVCEKCGEEFD